MKYKCIKTLYVGKYDEEGIFTGKKLVVPIGSIWEVDNYTPTIIDDYIRLESETTWIEITRSILSLHFEEIKAVE